jgi:hypothetical protein
MGQQWILMLNKPKGPSPLLGYFSLYLIFFPVFSQLNLGPTLNGIFAPYFHRNAMSY